MLSQTATTEAEESRQTRAKRLRQLQAINLAHRLVHKYKPKHRQGQTTDLIGATTQAGIIEIAITRGQTPIGIIQDGVQALRKALTVLMLVHQDQLVDRQTLGLAAADQVLLVVHLEDLDNNVKDSYQCSFKGHNCNSYSLFGQL